MKNEMKPILAALLLSAGAAIVVAAPVAENWENHCAKCHGADGSGNTKIGKKLKLKDEISRLEHQHAA